MIVNNKKMNIEKNMMKVGILALQGDVREHKNILKLLDSIPIEVKLPKDLDNVDALIIPGGESSTIGILMKKYKLDTAIKLKYKDGMPIYGTCAGAIVLAKDIIDSKQHKLNLADISIKRNFYGSQIDSFEEELEIEGIGKFNGIFIRSPIIKKLYKGAKVLSKQDNNPVMVRQQNLLITTFHPELTEDVRVHKYFLSMAQEYKQIRDMQRDIENNHK